MRRVYDDGTYETVSSSPQIQTIISSGYVDQRSMSIKSTGSSHLLIGETFGDQNQFNPLYGYIRKVYIFNTAIDYNPTNPAQRIENMSASDLIKHGIVGHWYAMYDPNNVVNNTIDSKAVAISSNSNLAKIIPLKGHEFEGTQFYVNGCRMQLSIVDSSVVSIPSSVKTYNPHISYIQFGANERIRLQEISIWSSSRLINQIQTDLYGQLVASNEPDLQVYMSGSFTAPDSSAPLLPMSEYINNVQVVDAIGTLQNLGFANKDLAGCPAIGRCGPLMSANLYSPPSMALTVCSSIPYLTTYSMTVANNLGTLGGEILEAYVYINNNDLYIYSGKKVGDLIYTWVSQEQGDVQLLGYIEGAPPAPMANLTNKSSYSGATSISFSAPSSVSLKYTSDNDNLSESKTAITLASGAQFGMSLKVAPMGFGVGTEKALVNLNLSVGGGITIINSSDNDTKTTASVTNNETDTFTVKLNGALAPITNDQFMGSINTLTTANNTVGGTSSKTAILPNPNMGGFTTSNPPASLPKTLPNDEKFGARPYIPSSYGHAFVSSATLDVYQQTLVQSNTVYGFVKTPSSIPRDNNIVTFRLNSQYIVPGCLDGITGYVYNPATLPTGQRTYNTSTGQMNVLVNKNFDPSALGNNASYMKIVDAYQRKRAIDLQTSNSLALYQSAWANTTNPNQAMVEPVDFYNEHVWHSRGSTEEFKHSNSTSFNDVYTTTSVSSNAWNVNFGAKLGAVTLTILDAKFDQSHTSKVTTKYSYDGTASGSFDMKISYDGIESDTQMRNACNNDAHFILNNNSQYNSNNNSGLNLVSGSDGLIYNIIPSVTSGAGLPVNNNLDDAFSYQQPQPSYSSGNATGLTGNLEPYDRPGKTKLFRTYSYFLQPNASNADEFWNTVVDPIWLANSNDTDAKALRTAQGKVSIPWRVLYRVTYSERFLPPVTSSLSAPPQIQPLVMIPTTQTVNPTTSNALLYDSSANHNPSAGVVLVPPTKDGTDFTMPSFTELIQSNNPAINNVLAFDTPKTPFTIANWGDKKNTALLTQLMTSALGIQNRLKLTPGSPPNGIPQVQSLTLPVPTAPYIYVQKDVNGTGVYTVYVDPNNFSTYYSNLGSNLSVILDVNSNPIQYTVTGNTYISIQTNFMPSPDGTLMYFIQPPVTPLPSDYDPTINDLSGNYDQGAHGTKVAPQTDYLQEWRYYLVSSYGSNMTSNYTVTGMAPFMISQPTTVNGTTVAGFSGFQVAYNQTSIGSGGYVLVQSAMQYPNLNTNTETFADMQLYRSGSLFDTFPLGDVEVLKQFLISEYPNAIWNQAGSSTGIDTDIQLVLAKNITSYFNQIQQNLIPQ